MVKVLGLKASEERNIRKTRLRKQSEEENNRKTKTPLLLQHKISDLDLYI